MKIKEILSDSIVNERFLGALREIQDKNQENFKNSLSVGSKTVSGAKSTVVLYKEEKIEKVFLSFHYTKTEKSIIAYIKIMDEKVSCGVAESILFPMFREKVAKTFESLNGETNLKEIEIVKYFEQSPGEKAAR